MNPSPLVSVTIVTYNQEQYIAQTLESVLSQRVSFPYEILIGDDASTDTTPEIITNYASQYPDIIIPILRKKNVGATANGVDLIKRCRGKYIASLDGDDSWCNPLKLQMQVNFLNAHPEYVAVLSWCNMIDNKGKPIFHAMNNHYFIFPNHVFSLLDFQLGNIPGQFSSAMYRNIFPSLSFKWENLFQVSNMVGDQIITLLLCSNGQKIYVSHKRLSNYRYITSSTAAQNYVSTIDQMEDTSLYHFRYFNNLEKIYESITKTHINLRPRKYIHLKQALHAFRQHRCSANIKRIICMFWEEKHPILLILDGIIYKRKYKKLYITSDKAIH